MNFDNILSLIDTEHLPSYRFKQLLEAVGQGIISWDEMPVWPKVLQNKFSAKFPYVTWTKTEIQTSLDGTQKAILTLKDNAVIETVLMQSKPGHWSICLSSEVGCAMGCAFCATGALGFRRKLTAEEITDQILFWKHHLLRQITKDQPALPAGRSLTTIKSVVFMGEGEPFHNTKEVFTAISWINQYYALGSRHISVSTCGIPDGIIALSRKYPQVNLAVSLHSANQTIRSSLMPINKTISLEQLKSALLEYISITKRQIMFEYLLINGINDREADLSSLVTWLSDLPKSLVHVNLIKYNQTNDSFSSSTPNQVKEWKLRLEQRGISVSIRKNLGADIQGACGQLAAVSKPVL